MQVEKAIEIPSRRYGKYLVRSRIGEGGMAEVFLAEAIDELGDQIRVAVKLMRPGVSEETFADEADLMGLLSHPNLVQALEVGQAFGRQYIAMEFLLGGDLRGVMETHRRQMNDLPTSMGVHVVIEVLKALAYFHQAKTRSGAPLALIHGDVNPSNVFFSGIGEVKLGDFGVAKSGRNNIGPGDGVAAGKLHYLSPEQTRGEPLAPSSDLFSVGVMLHELVVGYHPFLSRDRDPKAVMAAIRAAKLAIPDYVERPLAAILQKAMSPDVRTRYHSASVFGSDLFGYALDANLCQSQKEVQAWLERVLGLLL